jgi:hypothetical protein
MSRPSNRHPVSTVPHSTAQTKAADASGTTPLIVKLSTLLVPAVLLPPTREVRRKSDNLFLNGE